MEKFRDEEITDRKEKRKEADRRGRKEEQGKDGEVGSGSKQLLLRLQPVQLPVRPSAPAESESEAKMDNESAVNSSTQQLAENLAQDVLAPVLQSSSGAAPPSTRSVTQTARRGRGRGLPFHQQVRSMRSDFVADDASVDENPV